MEIHLYQKSYDGKPKWPTLRFQGTLALEVGGDLVPFISTINYIDYRT